MLLLLLLLMLMLTAVVMLQGGGRLRGLQTRVGVGVRVGGEIVGGDGRVGVVLEQPLGLDHGIRGRLRLAQRAIWNSGQLSIEFMRNIVRKIKLVSQLVFLSPVDHLGLYQG